MENKEKFDRDFNHRFVQVWPNHLPIFIPKNFFFDNSTKIRFELLENESKQPLTTNGAFTQNYVRNQQIYFLYKISSRTYIQSFYTNLSQ